VSTGIELHGKEGHVGRDICDSKPLVEFDGIDHEDRVALEIDMLETEIAVSITDPSLHVPLLEDVRVVLEESELPGPDRLERLRIEEAADEGLNLREIFFDIGSHDVTRSQVSSGGRGCRVERRESGGKAGEVVVSDLPVSEQILGVCRLRQPTHPYGIVHDDPIWGEGIVSPVEVDGHDVQVDVGSQSAVHPHFLVAEVPPSLKGRVVHELVVNRSLHLPNLVVCDEDPGDVGRDATYGRRAWRRVCVRSFEVLQKCRRVTTYLHCERSTTPSLGNHCVRRRERYRAE
jgi:hypothetical protein